MTKYLKQTPVFIFTFLLAQFSLASVHGPDIENGEVTKLEKYNTIIQIKKGWGTCSATLIEPYIILTAAHCVSDFDRNSKEYEQTLKEGSFIGVGRAENVYIHPDYATELSSGKFRIDFDYDLALIEVREFNDHSKIANPNFIPIVNEVKKINFHPSVQMVGFGAQNTNIEKDIESHVFSHDTLKQGKKLIGQNEISNCTSCDEEERKKIGQFELKTKYRQIIHNQVEKTDFLGSDKSGILPGDSGSPLVEIDKESQQMVVTGVASNITPQKQKNEVSFTLSYAGEVVSTQKVDYWPHEWALNKKPNDDFSVIRKHKTQVAHELNVPAEDLQVHRMFDRESIGRYVNLLYPANAKFINENLKKIRENVKKRLAESTPENPQMPTPPTPDRGRTPPVNIPPQVVPPRKQQPQNLPQVTPRPQMKTLAEIINNTACSYSEKGKKNSEVPYPHSCYCQFKSNMQDLIWKCYDISKEKDADGKYPRI